MVSCPSPWGPCHGRALLGITSSQGRCSSQGESCFCGGSRRGILMHILPRDFSDTIAHVPLACCDRSRPLASFLSWYFRCDYPLYESYTVKSWQWGAFLCILVSLGVLYTHCEKLSIQMRDSFQYWLEQIALGRWQMHRTLFKFEWKGFWITHFTSICPLQISDPLVSLHT